MVRVGRIDLNLLAMRDPAAAQVGYWLNHPGFGGVDLDGDPAQLSWAEFTNGQNRLLAMYPADPQLRAGVLRLHQVFALQAQPVEPPAPRSWKDALAVRLSTTPPRPGRATAYGGLCITSRGVAQQKTARIALPFPTSSAHQQVDPRSLEIKIADQAGRPIDAIKRFEIIPQMREALEKALLVLELDHAKLPAGQQVFVRWKVDAQLEDRRVDLTQPIPLFGREDVAADVARWLEPAPMIQSEHPAIRALAARARGGARTLQQLVSNTLAVIDSVRRKETENWPANFQNDALSFATTGWGECTAHGNLFAAMMRANGVPCRIVNGISRGIGYPMNMHYQNEYYAPGRGWVHVEPQGREIQSARYDMIQTGVLSPELEQHGAGFMHYLGVQQLSMIGMEVDAENRPLPPEARTLNLEQGLAVSNSKLHDVGIHGAA